MGQWQDDLLITKNSSGADAFGHIRVSIPEALIAILGQYDLDPLEMETGATGSGVTPSHNSNTKLTRLSANSGIGTSFSQSYNYWSYQPGRSQRVEVAGRLGAPVAGAVASYGYFDSENGLIYRQNGTSGVEFVVRSSTTGAPVDIVAPQASWNLDKLDGTGLSLKTLDITKVFILTLDLEFIGMGRVRMGFNIDGIIIYAHEFLHTNIDTVPYMQTATLPIQVLLEATSTATPAETFFKGALVMSEGGLLKELGYTFATPRGFANVLTGVRTHVLTVRPKLTFNGIINRQAYETHSLTIQVNDKPIFWELVVGANFSVTPTFADVNTVFSGTEYGTGGTFSNLTGGCVLAAGFAGTKGLGEAINIPLDLHHPLALNRAGLHTPIGTLTLLATAIDGDSDPVSASFNFTELR